LFLFTKNILEGKPIDVFNHGHHRRDFTYVDDIVNGVIAAMDKVASPNPQWDSAKPDPSTSLAPYRLYNIGNAHPVELIDYISILEKKLHKKALKNLLPMQLGDAPDSWADVEALAQDVGYRPTTSVEVGIGHFVDWYLEYYRVAA
jgi:UDP-glucuronate 4-epimerase